MYVQYHTVDSWVIKLKFSTVVVVAYHRMKAFEGRHTRLILLCRKHENTLWPARWSDLRDPCCLDLDFSRIPDGPQPSDLEVGELMPHRSSTSTSPSQHLMPLVDGEFSLLIKSPKLASDDLTSVSSRLSLASGLPSSFIVASLNANQYLETNTQEGVREHHCSTLILEDEHISVRGYFPSSISVIFT